MIEVVATEYGEMAERLNAPDSKSGIPSRVSGVQIPLSPPQVSWIDAFLGRLAGKTRKVATLDEISAAASAGWAGQK